MGSMGRKNHKFYSTTVLLFLPILAASPNCTQYGVCSHYVPAPPGQAPNCAKWGDTYCEHIDHYPMQLIKYLIEKSGFDYNTLLNNESREDFVFRKPESYGPPTLYDHSPPIPQFYGGPPLPLIQPALSYGPLSFNASQPHHHHHTHHHNPVQDGYPDRRYKIDPHLLTNALQQPPGYRNHERGNAANDGFLYSPPFLPPLQPDLPTVPWWHRYRRSTGKKERARRQTTPRFVNQLCPTASNFIMPKAALNTKGSWKYTVNLNELDQRYTQLVRSETCISDQCNGLCSLPNGYTSRCEQKYVQKRLVALEGGGNNLYTDTFWFPHCCVCQIVSN